MPCWSMNQSCNRQRAYDISSHLLLWFKVARTVRIDGVIENSSGRHRCFDMDATIFPWNTKCDIKRLVYPFGPVRVSLLKIELNYWLITRCGGFKRKLFARFRKAAIWNDQSIGPARGRLPCTISWFALTDFHLPISADFLVKKIYSYWRTVVCGDAEI